ncbi:MAG TPA: hypothetical protein DCR93_03805 [Cytophagales bacterium]|nr:hypothetical protein [Cytophagales bacterium]
MKMANLLVSIKEQSEGFFTEFSYVKKISNWINKSSEENRKDRIIGWNNTYMIRNLLLMESSDHPETLPLLQKYYFYLTKKVKENNPAFIEQMKRVELFWEHLL